MVVTVNGKERVQGTSKKGSAYDFYKIHFLAPQRGVTGQAAIQKIVDPSVINYDDILVDQAYEIVIDLRGDIVGMKEYE